MFRKIKNFKHLIEALLANQSYGFPSKKMIVIGVTGTDGKTTTTSLIYHILKYNNKKPAMISTLGAAIGDKVHDVGFHVTTPSSFKLQKYIKKAKGYGAKYLVLEITSHSIDQNRVYGINFDIGVITNITHEHLDYHKNYMRYLNTKLKLLFLSRICVINKDDQSYEIIKSKIINQKMISYGLGEDTDVNPYNFNLKTSLVGDFNKYNILAAVAVCKTLGISDNEIKKSLESYSLPLGRQEIVYDKDFKVMIDFAHTPNAFKRVLSETKKINKGRLIHVFGSAGERDVSKRPLMGKESSEYSDIIILTAEDPRSESVDVINKEIEKGINDKFKFRNFLEHKDKDEKNIYLKINDRTEAIKFAISIAKKGDLVILTGKSHEKSMNYGKGEVSWDEFKEVNLALQKFIK